MQCRGGWRGEGGENSIKGLVEKVRTSGSVKVGRVSWVGVVVIGVVVVIVIVISVSSSRVALVVVVVVIWEGYVVVFCFFVYLVDNVFIVWVEC